MATPEQVQELVARIQAMETREQTILTREQTLHGEVQTLTAQLTTAQQAGSATLAGGTQAPGVGAVDTRSLGKPDVFDGTEAKWHDFRVIFKAYCA
eukprot:548921-Amphidinium_carterae.1